MANYPLKKIQIGSDTYEIQSKKTYRVTLEASLSTPNNIGSLSIKEILETYDSSIQWDITSIVDTGWGSGSYDPQQVMIDDLDGVKFFNATYMFDGGDGLRAGSFINWAPNDSQASVVMFGIDESNLISGLVSVIVDTENNTVGNMILSSFGGGGGGGGFTPLHINKNGSLASLSSLSQSDTVEILDSLGVSCDINNIATYLSQGSILKMAQVGSPSPKTYTDIIHIDIVNKTLTLIFNNSGTNYIMVLNNTWNVNWNVQLLQRIMTQ